MRLATLHVAIIVRGGATWITICIDSVKKEVMTYIGISVESCKWFERKRNIGLKTVIKFEKSVKNVRT